MRELLCSDGLIHVVGINDDYVRLKMPDGSYLWFRSEGSFQGSLDEFDKREQALMLSAISKL